jgi:hypothetical protein
MTTALTAVITAPIHFTFCIVNLLILKSTTESSPLKRSADENLPAADGR